MTPTPLCGVYHRRSEDALLGRVQMNGCAAITLAGLLICACYWGMAGSHMASMSKQLSISPVSGFYF